jgi:hypothetical protein
MTDDQKPATEAALGIGGSGVTVGATLPFVTHNISPALSLHELLRARAIIRAMTHDQSVEP